MPSPPLACSVRDCALPLARQARTWRCPRGHTFDIARRGYVNLLQPQDRRSPEAGDSPDAVDARARLLACGVGTALIDEVRDLRDAWPDGSLVVDLGCGSGDALAHVAHAHAIAGIGIDLSTAAIERAARSNPEMTWVVANADRRLPLLDASVDRVLSLHARRNPAECARVMKRDGTLVVAVPAEDDLVELRALVQGAPLARDRTAALVDEHAPWFHLIDRAEARQSVTLDHDALRDLLRGTYRGERHSQSSALDGVHFLEVTLASRILRFAPLG